MTRRAAAAALLAALLLVPVFEAPGLSAQARTSEQRSAYGLPQALPAEVGLSAEQLARIQPLLRAAVEEGKIAGAVTLVARHGRIASLDTAGYRRLADSAPMGAGTLFRIASMTKPITSAAAMILIEEGRLALSDPVARYIPEFADARVAVEHDASGTGRAVTMVPARRPVTIRDLLTHTSGLTYGYLDDGPAGDAYRAAGVSDGIAPPGATIATMAARLGRLPLRSQPGSAFHYGLSTDVLGRVVEVVSGMTLAEFLESRLFAPLGMRDTRFDVADARSRLAVPYTPARGGLRPIAAIERFGLLRLAGDGYFGSDRYFSGGSGLVSTAADYARFLQMILNGGTLDGVRVLAPATVELLTADAVGPLAEAFIGPGAGFSLGFKVLTDTSRTDEPGSPGALSWGGIYGTAFWADPAEALIGIVLIQAFPTRSIDAARQVQSIMYDAILE